MLFQPAKEDNQLERRTNVVKFKQRRSINIGVIIFIIIFIYIVANVYMYFTKQHLSVYEVQAGTTADDTVAQGVIIRDEELIYTDTAGYISYYQKEGERVSKKSTLYSIDESKQVYELMTNNSTLELKSSDLEVIQKDVMKFLKEYSDSNFSDVTDFKYDIENTVTEVMFDRTMDNIQELLSENGIVANFEVVTAKDSGIVTYHCDNYESLKPKDVTAETFSQEDYKKTQLRSSDLIAENQPVCKIVKSEDWNIVLLLSDNQYEQLKERTKVRVTILEDGFNAVVPVETYQSGDQYFAKLYFDKYMSNYLDDRFLEVELHLNSAEGLKIPKTAVTEKSFYVVPRDMFSYGGDSTNLGLTTITYDTNGEITANFVETKIYYEDDNYAYISSELFEYGTKVQSTETQDVIQLTTTSALQGVYNVNNGYFIFEKVDIIYENEDYYIVKANVENSISVYDQIALDASLVIEDAILY